MKFFKYFLILTMLINYIYSYEPSSNNSGFPGEYLYSFGSSAKVLAVGGAGTGITNNSSIVYFNPAGISNMVNKEVTLFYAPLYLNSSFNFVSIAYPIVEGSVLGVSRTAIDVGGVEKTDSNGNVNGSGNSNEACYMISYGQKVFPYLFVGSNVKVITSSIDIYSSTGYGIDLGIILKPVSFFDFGLNIQNLLQPQITLNTDSDRYPTNIRIGCNFEILSNQLYLYTDVLILNVLPQLNVYSDGYKMALRWFEGIEYKPLENISLRCGINYKEITAGCGYKTNDFDIDYCVGFHTLGITHRVSLNLRFGLLLSETEKWIKEKEKEVNFKTYYSRGIKLFNDKKYKEAREEIKNALEILPENKEAKELLIQIESDEMKFTARTIFESALEDFESGKEVEAREKIEQARKYDSEIADKIQKEYLEKVEELIKNKEYENCKKLISRVLFVNPDNKNAQELFKKLQSILEFVK